MINNKLKILRRHKTIVKSNKAIAKMEVNRINKDRNRQENKCIKKEVQTQTQTVSQTQVHHGKATTRRNTSKRTTSIRIGRTTTIREMIRKRKRKNKKVKKPRLFLTIMIFQALADPLSYLLYL